MRSGRKVDLPDAVVSRLREGRGREEDFEYLFRKFEPMLRDYVWRKGCPAAEIEDMVQDIMIRVYKGMGSYRGEASLSTWIRTIAANVWKSSSERKGRQMEAHAISLSDALTQDDESGPHLPEPSDPSAFPDERAGYADGHRRLRATLAKLPAEMRQSLLLFAQGYKLREIAELRRVSIATVKKQIQQGRKRLRALLGPGSKLFGLVAILILLR